MDISKKTLDELKSLAYDLLLQQANLNQNLQIINAEIQKRQQPAPPITGSKGK